MNKEDSVNRKDILLALSDNLQDTMEQFLIAMELISENSLRVNNLEEQMKRLYKEFLDISYNQIEIKDYINKIIHETNYKIESLRENIDKL